MIHFSGVPNSNGAIGFDGRFVFLLFFLFFLLKRISVSFFFCCGRNATDTLSTLTFSSNGLRCLFVVRPMGNPLAYLLRLPIGRLWRQPPPPAQREASHWPIRNRGVAKGTCWPLIRLEEAIRSIVSMGLSSTYYVIYRPSTNQGRYQASEHDWPIRNGIASQRWEGSHWITRHIESLFGCHFSW